MSDVAPIDIEFTPSPNSEAYQIILGPGEVRHMRFRVLLASDIESLIAQLARLSPTLIINSPIKYSPPRQDRYRLSVSLQFDKIDALLANKRWDEKLRAHHALGELLVHDGMPSFIYCAFHVHFQLGEDLAFAECQRAWMKAAWYDTSGSLTDSYRQSEDHMVLRVDVTEVVVFKKTDFVRMRLAAIAEQEEGIRQEELLKIEQQRQQDENEQAQKDIETLRKSQFDSFVYLMEDLRNGAFKIGRSRTPGKRERTLQSEEPEINLRFAIPSDEQQERRMHVCFSHKRTRGEWFELTADDLIWIISDLKKHGDVSRASVDFEWLGKVFMQSAAKRTDSI